MTADIHMPFFSNINLDLVKTQAWVPQQIFATEGDIGYGQIFSLYENGNPYTSATVANLNFRAIKPDNNIVDIKGGTGFKAIDGQSNQFAFQVPAQTFAATGRVECYFYVTSDDGGIVASTTHFFYEVQRSVPSQTGSVSYIASLEGIIAEANTLKKQADDLVAGLSESKTNASTMVNDFQSDLVSKEQDIDNQAKQMLANAKAQMDKVAGDATDYQTKLDALNKQYIQKYNELLAQLPNASDAVKKQIADALAQIKDDEQDEFQKISMDWVNKKQALDDSITTYKDSVTKELDALKQQIAGLSGDNVAQLSKQIDDLQTKLNGMHLADYYTKKEIDDKLADYQPSIDLSGYETKTDAEQTYAKKSDIVAPDLSGYETKTDAEQTYAKKTDIPASPDLSDYAKSADVAKTYETKADADETYAKKTDIVAPDLSSYETSKHASDTYETKADAATHITKETADATYAKQSDIPDLSGYAKKTDIPQGQDLSAYETKEDAESTYAKKSDIPVPQDLTSYAKTEDIAKNYETKSDAGTHLTKEDAQSTYATKDDLANVKPDMTGYAKTSDIPDVSGFETASHAEQMYETKADANETYAKKTDIPAEPDLSGYAKKSDIPAAPDLSGYETKTDADATYAKKSDIPASQDLSEYAKTSDVAKTYETKDDANNTFVSHLQVARNETGGRSEDNTNYAEIWVAPNSYDTTGGYFDLSTTDHAFPAMLTVDTSFYKDPDNKAAIAASSNSQYNGYIFKEDGKFFLSGKQLLTNDDKPDLSQYLTTTTAADTYAKKSDIPVVPDLSGYETSSHAEQTYETKAMASTHLTKSTADGLYAKISGKGEGIKKIVTFSGRSQKQTTELVTADANELDLYRTQPYLTFPSVIIEDDFAKTVSASEMQSYLHNMSTSPNGNRWFFSLNGDLYNQGNKILTDKNTDLSQYATKDDLKKAGTGTTPDLSQYLTKKDASSTYVKRGYGLDLPRFVGNSDSQSDASGFYSISSNTGFARDNNYDVSAMSIAFPCVMHFSSNSNNTEEKVKAVSAVEADAGYILEVNGSYFIGGHKLAFAD